MDLRRRGLYVRWCQSLRAELIVGEDASSSDSTTFLVPQEFLRRRSRTLREKVEANDLRTIHVPDTAISTLTEFFVWSHSPVPQLDDRLSFGEVVDLSIFAWKYQISALSNQVTDRIRANLATGEWQLQAAIVDSIYQTCQADSPLREVVKAALGQLSRSSIDGEEWEKTFRNNPDLGWDYLRAGDKEWARQEYLSGVCRFHNHDGIKRQEGLCDGCPYAEADCYPEWEEDETYLQEGAKAAADTPALAQISAPASAQESSTVVDTKPAPTPQPVNGMVAEHEPVNAPSYHPAEESAPGTSSINEKKEGPESTTDLNGHIDSEESESAVEEINEGIETPHINGVNKATATEEARSESLYPDSLSSDRETLVKRHPNGTSMEKTNGTVMVTSVPEAEAEAPKLTKNQRKKRAKRMSVSHGSDLRAPWAVQKED